MFQILNPFPLSGQWPACCTDTNSHTHLCTPSAASKNIHITYKHIYELHKSRVCVCVCALWMWQTSTTTERKWHRIKYEYIIAMHIPESGICGVDKRTHIQYFCRTCTDFDKWEWKKGSIDFSCGRDYVSSRCKCFFGYTTRTAADSCYVHLYTASISWPNLAPGQTNHSMLRVWYIYVDQTCDCIFLAGMPMIRCSNEYG